MNTLETFDRAIEAARQRLDTLEQRAATTAPLPPGLVDESITALSVSVEELQVAGEELRQVNDELATAEAMVAAERERYRALFEFAPDTYVVTDLAGTVQEANQAAGRLLGLPPRWLVGKPLLVFVAPAARRAVRTVLNHLARAAPGPPPDHEWEVELQPRGGRPRWVAVRAAVDRAPDGQPAGLRWLVRDISDRKRVEAELQALNATLEQRVAERTADLQAARAAAEQAADRTARLQEVTAALAGALTAERVAAVVIERGAAAVGAVAGVIALVSDDGAEVRWAIGYGAVPDSVWRPLPLAAALPVSEVTRTGEPVWIESRAALAARYPALEPTVRPDVQAMAALPLRVGERTLGALRLCFAEARAFDVADRAFLLALAGQCAQALERARLYAAEQAIRAALATEQATLAAVMNSLSDGLILQDATGHIRYCNAAAGRLFGVAPAALLGQPAEVASTLIHPALADADAVKAAWQAALGRLAERPGFEMQVVGPPPRVVLVQFFPVAGGDAVTGVGIMLRDVTDVKRLALLEERERIATDLHDGVIQSLYAVGLGLAAGERRRDADPAALRTGPRHAIDQLNTVIQDIRTYIFDLRPAPGDEPALAARLAALAADYGSAARRPPALAVDPAAAGLVPPAAVPHLLQIAREALANASRHAGAGHVQIELALVDGQVRLTVRDDGRGFDRAQAARGGGQGLRNMTVRAAAVGGCLTIDSAPGAGTVVRVDLPSEARRAET